MDAEHYDLVVIGPGPAGEKGAAQVAYHGRRVAIVERSPTVGGTAVRDNIDRHRINLLHGDARLAPEGRVHVVSDEAERRSRPAR